MSSKSSNSESNTTLIDKDRIAEAVERRQHKETDQEIEDEQERDLRLQ